MDILDWKDRPFVTIEQMDDYEAIDHDVSKKYGRKVKAAQISNRDYQYRYQKLSKTNNMKPPPSAERHIMLGYIVVRKLGTHNQYETWMPEIVFDDVYQKVLATS